MSRKRALLNGRQIRFTPQLVTRLINRVVLDGKRGWLCRFNRLRSFEQIKEATGNDALEVSETAMENHHAYLYVSVVQLPSPS